MHRVVRVRWICSLGLSWLNSARTPHSLAERASILRRHIPVAGDALLGRQGTQALQTRFHTGQAAVVPGGNLQHRLTSSKCRQHLRIIRRPPGSPGVAGQAGPAPHPDLVGLEHPHRAQQRTDHRGVMQDHGLRDRIARDRIDTLDQGLQGGFGKGEFHGNH